MDVKTKYEYLSIDYNWTRHPEAYCRSKKRVLTKKQMNTHRCETRNCMHLNKNMIFE